MKWLLKGIAAWLLLGSLGLIILPLRSGLWNNVPPGAMRVIVPFAALLWFVAFPACVGAVRLWRLTSSGLIISGATLGCYAMAELLLLGADAFWLAKPLDPKVFARFITDALALSVLASARARQLCSRDADTSGATAVL